MLSAPRAGIQGCPALTLEDGRATMRPALPTIDRSPTMSRLEGRRAVITGAASGIGEQTARLFVAEGATVVLADVDDERGTAIAAELGAQTRYVHVDVAEEGAIEHAIEESVSGFGGLDCVFNNAGNPGSLGRVEDIDMDLFDRTVGIHLRGVFPV